MRHDLIIYTMYMHTDSAQVSQCHHMPSKWACGWVDRVLDQDQNFWFLIPTTGHIEVPGKFSPAQFTQLSTWTWQGPPSRNGYLVHRAKVGSTVAGCHRRPLQGVMVNGRLIIPHICSDLKTNTYYLYLLLPPNHYFIGSCSLLLFDVNYLIRCHGNMKYNTVLFCSISYNPLSLVANCSFHLMQIV